MGGSSTSRVTFNDGMTAFEGELIVEGGGFASARLMQPFELSRGVEALALEARGDGRMGYKVTLTSAAAAEGVSYQFALPMLAADEFTSVRMPLAAFRPTFRGRPAPDAPPLRAYQVRGLGLMLSRYEVEGGVKAAIPAGSFRLVLRRLTTAASDLSINGRRWVQPPPPPPPRGGGGDSAMCMPAHVHEPYTREDDAYLWKHQADLEGAAAALGRGVRSCTARLKRLRKPTSEGYRRLFGVDEEQMEDGGAAVAHSSSSSSSSSLRCARDCIQRILHDAALDPRSFSVGYSDRFLVRPREVAFARPNDSIRGSERLFVLALPEHRVAFIKYRKRLVWHKEMRLDLIFGSHGGHGTRIGEVVETYDTWEAERRARLSAAMARATVALGGSREALRRVKLHLKRTAHGECSLDEFVDVALDKFVDCPPALLELIASLPDEDTSFRDELCSRVEERIRRDQRATARL